MIPNKLNHGDNLTNLFEKFNEVIDYLRQIRLVAGNGIRLNRLPAGTTIESTATATAGGMSAPSVAAHPFDAEIVNKGTDENPSYYVRIYNSALPDSPYAGVVYVYEYEITVPVTEFAITTNNGFFVALDVDFTQGTNPPYSVTLSVVPYGSGGEVGYTTYREYIAEGKLPNVASRVDGDISVYGRWV
ncbi:MAG: hypothetical protein J5858_07500 [Lentisphaeria bacterium]|nr:hypothetical protein [Lentisphaeria bacterium]